MFSRADVEAVNLSQDELRWISAMTLLLENTPRTMRVTMLVSTSRGGSVVTCDCCEHCAAEMVLEAARNIVECDDGNERPGFSETADDGLPERLDS